MKPRPQQSLTFMAVMMMMMVMMMMIIIINATKMQKASTMYQ